MDPPPPQQRFKLALAYRGTAYNGWQRQLPPGGAELPTVQNTLRLALQRVVGHPVTVQGSSRTDSGVHALGQVAHFDTIRLGFDADKLVLATNARLPPDVRVNSAERVGDDFDAIRSTVEKAYRYTVHNAPLKDVFAGDLSLQVPKPLDVGAMNDAASALVGGHDFASFAKPGHGRETTVRTVTSAAVERRGETVSFEVVGKGFLWHQVRIMAGTLIEVGLGRRDPSTVGTVLAAKDRLAAGPTAAAHGLCLLWVRTAEGSRTMLP